MKIKVPIDRINDNTGYWYMEEIASFDRWCYKCYCGTDNKFVIEGEKCSNCRSKFPVNPYEVFE